MNRYMLDTNTVSHLIRGHPHVARRVVAAPMASICISAITKGELLFGLAKRPDAKRLHGAVWEFLRCADVLPWSDTVAERYGVVRAEMGLRGKVLSTLDMLIAAHALSVDAILVTNDGAFAQVADLHLEDWTIDASR